MIPNKMGILWCKSPTTTTKTLSRGFGFDLSHARGLSSLTVHASSSNAAASDGIYKTSYVGDLREDGRYEFPIHCHGENLLSGEEFAAAVLAAAEKSTSVTASLEGNILTFSSKGTVSLLPTGRLRGALNEIFTIMFRISAPENSGSSVSSGIALAYSYGSQSVSYSGTYAGETVQMIANSTSSKQLVGLSLTTTSGLVRKLDISSFGVFRGTVGAESFEPYAGTTTSFTLAEPLRTLLTTRDYAYPLQGYAERYVKATLFRPEQAQKTELGSSYPVYFVPWPEELHGRNLRMDRLYLAANESTLIGAANRYMTSADKTGFLISAPATKKTEEGFLSHFHSLNASLIDTRSEPLIERFPPITLPTHKGRNYAELKTAIAPSALTFTYL